METSRMERNLNEFRMDGSTWQRGRNVLLGAAALGWAACVAAFATDHARFSSSYLVAFAFFITIVLGAMFFVMLQHLTGSAWSVTVRRTMENMMVTIPAGALLFIPVALGLHDLYHWTHAEAVAADPILQGKVRYLNEGFFLVRAMAYFAIWSIWALILYRNSVQQDRTGSIERTESMVKWSAPGMIMMFITVTLASFDWIMSLDPHWFSTIFGVYVFAGGVLAFTAAVIVISMAMQRAGVMRHAITMEHYHDLGKWLFAFTVFWAYIAFCQYLLIWYANIPEETIWYKHRFEGTWLQASGVLLFGHFLIPFLLMLSRGSKRNLRLVGATAVFVLAMHYVDMYWLIMPVFQHHGVQPSWMDLGALLGVGATLGLVFWTRMKSTAIAPVGDPRLAQCLEFENV
jgi:hypothetical protein